MKIAITGANGFVGRSTIQYFFERGDAVAAVTWIHDPLKLTFDSQVRLYESDFSREDLRNAFRGMDAVIHLAGLRPTPKADAIGITAYFDGNVRTTEAVIIAAGEEGVGRVVQASSIAAYFPGQNQLPYNEAQAPVPLSLYGISKVACENLGHVYERRYTTRVVSLRFAQIYGPGEREGLMMMKFIQQACNKLPQVIVGEGKIFRDYIYLKDIISAMASSVEPGKPSGVFNIGGGRGYTVREVAEMVNTVFENEGNIKFDLTQPETGASYFMDSTKAEKELGWKSQWTLRAGLEDLKTWYQQNE